MQCSDSCRRDGTARLCHAHYTERRQSVMEGGVLVLIDLGLPRVDVLKRVLGAVVMRVIILVNSLSLQPGDGVEFLDLCCTQAREGTEDRTLDLGHLSIL